MSATARATIPAELDGDAVGVELTLRYVDGMGYQITHMKLAGQPDALATPLPLGYSLPEEIDIPEYDGE